MIDRLLVPITAKGDVTHAGGKAEQIAFLLQKGYRVPQTFVCPWDIFTAAQKDETAVLSLLHTALAESLDSNSSYAVRSSANVEDNVSYSFAGQFETILNVSGLDAILQAIQTVWSSALAPGVASYLEKAGLATVDLKMAVVIQEMVPAVTSGVSFSKNPLTGMDETIVEAVSGTGTALVEEGITPDRWVHKWGKWLIQPENSEISLELIAQIVAETKQIAQDFGDPIDLEWVYDGTAVNWVQVREITSLSNLNIYSNRISREVLPGLIKPLIWSINVPLVNSAWIDLFTESIGPNEIEPDDLSKAFYYRSYFNMSTIGQVFTALGMPTETLELMMGMEGGDEKPRFKPSGQTCRHLPRMLRFGLDKLRFGRKIERFLPEMQATYQQFDTVDLQKLDDEQLLGHIKSLYAFTQHAAYYNIVGPLLMAAYNNRLESQLTKLGVDFMQFDIMRGVADWEKYDPNVHLAQLHDQFSALPQSSQAVIRQQDYETFRQMSGDGAVTGFQQAVQQFIVDFGHFSDSGNDFSAIPWREDRDLVLKMIVKFVPPTAANKKLGWEELPLTGTGRWRLKGSYQRTRRFRLYREAISYWYTYGYGLFRNAFREIGRRLVRQDGLSQMDDIFFLYRDEARHLLNGRGRDTNPRALVTRRQAEIEAAAAVILPDVIFGDEPPPLLEAKEGLTVLTGIPTSRGYFKGPVTVISSIQEFDQVKKGSVIVIPYSDVSWTPLFTKAGAVIAESGGMLSHSSIVAREYNLPAVVSVNGACRLLPDNTLVSVDGFKGEIIIHEAVGKVGV